MFVRRLKKPIELMPRVQEYILREPHIIVEKQVLADYLHSNQHALENMLNHETFINWYNEFIKKVMYRKKREFILQSKMKLRGIDVRGLKKYGYGSAGNTKSN